MPRRNPRKSSDARLPTASDNSLPSAIPVASLYIPGRNSGFTRPVQAKLSSSTGPPGTSTPHGLALREVSCGRGRLDRCGKKWLDSFEHPVEQLARIIPILEKAMEDEAQPRVELGPIDSAAKREIPHMKWVIRTSVAVDGSRAARAGSPSQPSRRISPKRCFCSGSGGTRAPRKFRPPRRAPSSSSRRTPCEQRVAPQPRQSHCGVRRYTIGSWPWPGGVSTH
jgi:hypothetical protein